MIPRISPAQSTTVASEVFFKIPPQIPGRKSVDGVSSDGVGHAKHAWENSPDVSPGFGFNGNQYPSLLFFLRIYKKMMFVKFSLS